jgi:hypothetical protein
MSSIWSHDFGILMAVGIFEVGMIQMEIWMQEFKIIVEILTVGLWQYRLILKHLNNYISVGFLALEVSISYCALSLSEFKANSTVSINP